MNNITLTEINGTKTVNARELHSQLGLRDDNFSHWFNIQTKDFLENIEYGLLVFKDEALSKAFRASSNKKDYWLTVDTAKHIALMSRTDKGREYRIRLIELENQQPVQEIAPSSQADSFMALKIMTDDLNLPESGKLQAYSIGMQKYPDFVQALPKYGIDKPVIDHYVEANTSGSSGVTHSLSYHLKNLNVGRSATAINKLLKQAGFLERKERVSSTGIIKHFNSVTKKGLKYGKNITPTKSQRETQPHYYDSMIDSLLCEIL